MKLTRFCLDKHPGRSLIILFLLNAFISCQTESACETNDYADPVIELTDPSNALMEVMIDTLMEVEFNLEAEAGLNTLSVNGEGIEAFTHGEKETTFIVSRFVWHDEELEFTLHDMCDASASVTVKVKVIIPDGWPN